MDDQNQQDNNQNITPTPSGDGAAQQVSSVPPQAAPAVPSAPPAAPHKELEPVIAPDVSFEAPKEAVGASETELQIEKELSEAGVESAVEKPFLTKEHTIVGIEHAKESVPLPTQPHPSMQLPMTQEEAEKIIKFHKKFTDSVVWLATIVLLQIKRMHNKVINS